MKSIVGINTEIPGLDDFFSFDTGQSLQDYDIILFSPKLPYYPTFSFTDGSTAIEKQYGSSAIKKIEHWRNELRNALAEGKTVFFLLAETEEENYITGISPISTSKRTTYDTSTLRNYDVCPARIQLVNAHGSKIKIIDPRFKELFNSIEGYVGYEAYLSEDHKSPIATTHTGGKAISAIYQLKDLPGHLVLLPYFDISLLIEEDPKGKDVWSKEALGIGTKLIKNFLDIDKVLKTSMNHTPEPEWIKDVSRSSKIEEIQSDISQIDREIASKTEEKKIKESELISALSPLALLYETGKPLELAIEEVLKQLGYEVTSFRDGSLEIDHVLISPENKRLIGEAEGKDSSAIGIDKFRQLESNINEDFQRDEISEPASGILFGNGFRLKEPSSREAQFTDKCLINAKRLSTVLIKTVDLFPIAMYLQDNPGNETFKGECRKVIESACGDMAIFPAIPK